MELRERYDPEDIETLLSERGFDELLEEERAYVLRHLSGREEYETMRSLLLHMRERPRNDEPATADPRVRTAVIEAFRAQRKPRFTIWLNSIGAALLPKEALASPQWWDRLWRPALTLASIALLLVGGWWYVQRGDLVHENELADLKQDDAPEQPAPSAPQANSGTASTPERGTATVEALEQAAARTVLADAERSATVVREEPIETLSANQQEAVEDRYLPPPVMVADLALEEMEMEKKNEAASEKFAEPASPMPASGRTVTAEDMDRNYSITNSSTGAVQKETRAKITKALTGSRNLADDEVLLSLLNTGW